MATKIKKTGNEKIGNAFSKLKESATKVGITSENIGAVTKKGASALIGATGTITNVAKNTGSAAVQKMKEVDLSKYKFNVEDVMKQALRLPIVNVDREIFLKRELVKYYPENVVRKAIDNNPAYAGIDRKRINDIANDVINYETNKVSSVSFFAGIPGGFAMAASVPADVLQYFAGAIIAMQKLAYLYGFERFDMEGGEIDDSTMNNLMIFLGVMFSVQGANAGVKIIAEASTQKVMKTLANKALTKGTIYPIVNQVSKFVGVKMTKDIFAKSVAKVVPVVGGVVSGGLTYVTFKPSCRKLQKSFMELNLSDPEFYRDIIEVDLA